MMGYGSLKRLCVPLAGCVLVLTLSACAAAAASPAQSEDLTHFERMIAAARSRAESAAPGAVLRQVDLDVGRDRRVFRFVDPAATREIIVDNDEVTVTTDSKLVGQLRPAIEVTALRVGPKAAAAAAANGLGPGEGCPPSLTLFERTWHVFCATSAGVLSATVDAVSGTFRASGGPAPRVPPTAAPR